MDAGQSGNPYVELCATDPDAHPSVLRQAAFRDIDRRNQLDPRYHRWESLTWQAQLLLQDTIDPETDAKVKFARLDVDIGRAPLDRLAHHVVDQLNYRRFLCHLTQLADVLMAIYPSRRTLSGKVMALLEPGIQILGAT
ncbi:hypothetical protein D9M71_566450 [compost metagenome]